MGSIAGRGCNSLRLHYSLGKAAAREGGFNIMTNQEIRYAIAMPIASREICKLCYSVNAIGFTVPDDVWNAVVPAGCRTQIVCLRCFARLADEKLISWDSDISFYPVSLATHLGNDNPVAKLVQKWLAWKAEFISSKRVVHG